jgi:hypothetical protein
MTHDSILCLIQTPENRHRLNQVIDIGLAQLAKGEKVDGKHSYQKMKNKIHKIAINNHS